MLSEKWTKLKYVVLFIISIYAFWTGISQLYHNLIEEKTAKAEYQNLRKLVYEDKESNRLAKTVPTSKAVHNRKKNKERYINLDLMYKKNQDFVGWISIPGEKIDYPVVQKKHDNKYYLNHDFYKRKNRYGVPFLDAGCDMENSESNLEVYGHHMKDGSMFAGLMKYKHKEYLKKHPEVLFYTKEEGKTVFRICAVCKVNGNKDNEFFNYFRNNTALYDFSEFQKKVEEKQLYVSNVEMVEGGQFLTLVTCEYSQDNARLLVVAQKKKLEEKKGC
ncbi:class B sortase [[Clostridium] polysaccharolyticum]|uniref:Sortase B n=1 Tax=[Clostridium] polysaccharolyticum TaxID=29364 RepID=A0A1I0FNU4_9FIRM|nr:class B sortase [[Clostridium] polysaccharolyticum]SET60018.1 sortase B [[Clostridium] polysaccharolyticum]